MKKLRNWFIGDYLAKTNDVFERARIELTYDYSIFFILLGLAFYGNLIANHLWYHFYLITFACFALITIPFMLKYTQNLKLAAHWYIIQQFITSVGSTFIQEFKTDLSGGFWTLSFIMFCMFIFGNKGGLIRAIPFILLFIGMLYNNIRDVPLDFGIPPEQQLQNEAIVTLVPFALCLYIVGTFLKTRNRAEQYISQQRRELEVKNKEVTDSISYAQLIQKAILPSQRSIEYFLPNSFVVYLPKDIVSGDFYWVEKKNEKIFFAVVDCTGHGVPGAMMSVIGQNALNRVLNEFNITTPARILDKLSELIEEVFAKSGAEVRDGMDLALCSLDTSTHTIEYAGANNSLCYISNGNLQEIKANKQPIGRFESRIPFTNHSIALQKGDSVYLFSDGIADQFGGPQGKKFKYKRVKELLLRISAKSHRDQRNEITETFFSWKGKNEQVDDVCVLGVRVG
jgi:serine phosphatase RsbU (regulator of sigma subunit)